MGNKSVIYRFLANCLSYPDKDFLDRINDDTLWVELVSQIKSNAISLEDDLDAVAGIIDRVAEENLEKLAVENTRLFINSYPKAVVIPYAYKYLGLDPEKSICMMEKIYTDSGLKVNESWKDRPDHFVLVLEFVTHALDTSQQELANGFMVNYGLKWFDEIFTNIMDNTEQEYYYGLAKLAKEWIKLEEAKYNL